MLTNTKRGGIRIYKNSQQLTLAFAGNNPQWDGTSVSAAVGDQVYLPSYSSSLNLDGNCIHGGESKLDIKYKTFSRQKYVERIRNSHRT